MKSAKVTMTNPKDIMKKSKDTIHNLHAIFFDVFGTVVDWRSSVAREVTAAAARHGLSVDAEALSAVRFRQMHWCLIFSHSDFRISSSASMLFLYPNSRNLFFIYLLSARRII